MTQRRLTVRSALRCLPALLCGTWLLSAPAAAQGPAPPPPTSPPDASVLEPAPTTPPTPPDTAAPEPMPATPPGPEPAAAKATYPVHRAAAPIAIDGQLDEWTSAPIFGLPYETSPGDNIPAAVKTDVWITYDSDNIYVAFKAYDPEPQNIRARLTDRDRAFQDDFVGVVLDTFNDERRAFEFFVNPLGVQMDLFQNEITGNEDDTWDAIWSSAGRITEEGYVVELAVPFSSLRFPRAAGAQTWGIDALRIRPRTARARNGLNKLTRGGNCYLCHESKLIGMEGITPGRNIEFDPTLTAGRTDRRTDFPNGDLESGDEEAEVGLSARWGITPNLTLNAAINPDFSQVEADAAQLDVNTQFALFFPEKRPFFLEGADVFETRINAIYSRNIADPEWGLKLSGKEGRNALGVVVTQDRITNLLIPSSQRSRSRSLDQENLSTVLRYRRDIFEGSAVGFLYTGREGDDYHNRVAGSDALFKWKETEAVRIELLGSQTIYPGAITSTLPGQDGDLEGYALRTVYQHNEREWMGYLLYQDVSEDFRADLGFIPQVDFRRGNALYERYWYPEKNGWNRVVVGGQFTEDREQDNDPLRRQVDVYSWAQGPRESFLETHIYGGTRNFNGQEFDENYFTAFGEMRVNSKFYFYLWGRYGDAVDFENTRQGKQLGLEPGVRFDLGKHLRLTLDHDFAELEVDQGRLYTANLTELRATYQFNVRTFVRLITQYQQLDLEPANYTFPVDKQNKDIFNQLLFSYKLNPQTVLFLGYSDVAFGNQDLKLTKENQTVFFKIGYALLL